MISDMIPWIPSRTTFSNMQYTMLIVHAFMSSQVHDTTQHTKCETASTQDLLVLHTILLHLFFVAFIRFGRNASATHKAKQDERQDDESL